MFINLVYLGYLLILWYSTIFPWKFSTYSSSSYFFCHKEKQRHMSLFTGLF
jgi:hypothetical protein